MRRTIALLLALAVPTLVACGSDDEEPTAVVASTPLIADIARNVAGGRLAVDQVLPANADPHEYEPRPSDADAIAQADVVLRSGGDLDAWIGDLVDAAGGDARVVDLLAGVDDPIRDGEETDPHWWHDPRNVAAAASMIAEQLAEIDPGGAAQFSANADRYRARVEALDAAIAACVQGQVPRDDRKLVTTHDALAYFARRYGIEVIGSVVPSLSTSAQPSAGETAALVRQIRDEGVPAVFPEASIAGGLEQAIARESRARVGGELYADGLGPADSAGATYLGAQRHNAETIVAGLAGADARCELPG